MGEDETLTAQEFEDAIRAIEEREIVLEAHNLALIAAHLHEPSLAYRESVERAGKLLDAAVEHVRSKRESVK